MALQGRGAILSPNRVILLTIISNITLIMKTIFTKFGYAMMLLVSMGITIALLNHFSIPQSVSAQSSGVNYIQKMNISKGVTVSTTSVNLLIASSGRVYALIVNDGAAPVYLSLDGNAAVAGAGIRLNGDGGSYEINPLNQDVGIINAITASGSSNVTVTASQ